MFLGVVLYPMSSPFGPETKRGTEETLEAISRTRRWASRIDTKNDVPELDVNDFVAELEHQEEELRSKYKLKTTEVSIDNFVFNQEDTVIRILSGDLDEKVDAIETLQNYINDDFGRESPPDLSKEELMWLVAQEVSYHIESAHGLEIYEEELDIDLDSVGSVPEKWEEGFPIYNRS